MRYLVVRAGALGDTLMATPVVTALAERHPGATIDFLASASAAPLIVGHPAIGTVLTLTQRNWPYWLSPEKHALVRCIRDARYDAAFVLEHAPRYYELAERAGVPRVTGFRDVAFDPALHSIANNLRAAGFDDYQSRSWRMLIAPVDAPPPVVRELGAKARGPIVGIHIGYGPARRKKDQHTRLRGWALANWAAIAADLTRRGATVVLTGSRDDRASVEELRALVAGEGVVNLAGQLSLRESVALVASLDLLVSVDSGPAHIAAAVGTPVVVLWGPGILVQTRPVSFGSTVEIVREAVPCAPCYGTPAMRACRRNICMEQIAPARVSATIEGVLRDARPTARPSLRPPA